MMAEKENDKGKVEAASGAARLSAGVAAAARLREAAEMLEQDEGPRAKSYRSAAVQAREIAVWLEAIEPR